MISYEEFYSLYWRTARIETSFFLVRKFYREEPLYRYVMARKPKRKNRRIQKKYAKRRILKQIFIKNIQVLERETRRLISSSKEIREAEMDGKIEIRFETVPVERQVKINRSFVECPPSPVLADLMNLPPDKPAAMIYEREEVIEFQSVSWTLPATIEVFQAQERTNGINDLKEIFFDKVRKCLELDYLRRYGGKNE